MADSGQGVCREEDFSKFLMSETGAGSECAAGHVDDLAALRFPHFHLIPCFTEEGIRRPCRAWLDGNAQVHEKSFDLGKGFRIELYEMGSRHVVGRRALISIRPFDREKRILRHVDKRPAAGNHEHFLDTVRKEPLLRDDGSRRAQWRLHDSYILAVIIDDPDRDILHRRRQVADQFSSADLDIASNPRFGKEGIDSPFG